MNSTIYAVEVPQRPTRLVRTSHNSRAVRHVAADIGIRAYVPTKNQLVQLLSGGAQVEQPPEDAAEESKPESSQLPLGAA